MSEWDLDDLGGPVGPVEAESQLIQEKKVNKKKLGELEIKSGSKTLQLWKTHPQNHSKIKCDIAPVYLQVAMICSDKLYKLYSSPDKKSESSPMQTLSPSDSEAAYKFIWEWIRACGDEQSVAQISDNHGLISEEKGYQPLLDVLDAARKLEIPEASFSKFLIKKSKDLAKTILPDLELVQNAYDTENPNHEIREILISSIFDHWYNYVLDDEKHDEYMASLQKLRAEKSELDEDLFAAVQAKDEGLKAARERKKTREAEAAAEAVDTDADGTGVVATTWDMTGKNTDDAGANNTGVNDAWAGKISGDGYGAAGDGSWADEVNNSEHLDPILVQPVSVW